MLPVLAEVILHNKIYAIFCAPHDTTASGRGEKGHQKIKRKFLIWGKRGNEKWDGRENQYSSASGNMENV